MNRFSTGGSGGSSFSSGANRFQSGSSNSGNRFQSGITGGNRFSSQSSGGSRFSGGSFGSNTISSSSKSGGNRLQKSSIDGVKLESSLSSGGSGFQNSVSGSKGFQSWLVGGNSGSENRFTINGSPKVQSGLASGNRFQKQISKGNQLLNKEQKFQNGFSMKLGDNKGFQSQVGNRIQRQNDSDKLGFLSGSGGANRFINGLLWVVNSSAGGN